MKKILLTLFQLVVTIAVLYWVFHDPTKRAQMGVALRAADYRWIAAGIFAYIIVEVAAAVRWQILLKVQGIHFSLARVSGLFLIGMFYNQFLPGGTGGDIIKTYLLLKETPDKKVGALLAVLFDRLIGLMALIFITGTLIALRYHWLAQTYETRRLLWILLAILGSSVLALLTTFVVSGFNLFHSLPKHFPGREKLIEVSAAYHLYARHWRGTLLAFGASLIAHLATFSTFLCVAYAFRARVAVIDFFCHHADRAHHLVAADQLRRGGPARKDSPDHVEPAVRRPGSGRGIDRFDELSDHSSLLSARRHRLLLLQAERRSRTCEVARDEAGSRHARA